MLLLINRAEFTIRLNFEVTVDKRRVGRQYLCKNVDRWHLIRFKWNNQAPATSKTIRF